jgi:hypothetical protein
MHIIKGFNMALYDNNTNQTTPAQRTPKTDYSTLTHNGKKYDNLDSMVTQIAKERAHVAFKSTKLILNELGLKTKDVEIAGAMVKANEKMIHDYIKNKDDSRSLFGL